jgi:hypothetical protein
MRWAEFRGPGLANRLQTAIFGDSSGICNKNPAAESSIQRQPNSETFLLKTANEQAGARERDWKKSTALSLRSQS